MLDTFLRSYVRICKRYSTITSAYSHHVRNIHSNKLKNIKIFDCRWNKVKTTKTADSWNCSLSSVKMGGRQTPFICFFPYLIVLSSAPTPNCSPSLLLPDSNISKQTSRICSIPSSPSSFCWPAQHVLQLRTSLLSCSWSLRFITSVFVK